MPGGILTGNHQNCLRGPIDTVYCPLKPDQFQGKTVTMGPARSIPHKLPNIISFSKEGLPSI